MTESGLQAAVEVDTSHAALGALSLMPVEGGAGVPSSLTPAALDSFAGDAVHPKTEQAVQATPSASSVSWRDLARIMNEPGDDVVDVRAAMMERIRLIRRDKANALILRHFGGVPYTSTEEYESLVKTVRAAAEKESKE